MKIDAQCRFMVVEDRDWLGGHKVGLRFGNGYGVDIVQSPLHYCDNLEEFEVAVTEYYGECGDWHIATDTPISEDGVLGYLKWNEVIETIEQVAELPPHRKQLTY